MPSLKISQLSEITSVQGTDLIEVSQDAGGSAYSSKKIQLSNLASHLGIPGEISMTIDANGLVISTGKKNWGKMPYAGTIVSWDITGDQTGSCSISIEKCTYSGFPSFSSISASAPVTLTSAVKNTSSTLTGWTISFAAGDYIRPSVDSVSALTKIVLNLQVIRS